MSEFSVIIPTLQRAKELHELVEMCAAHPRVLEVLVINNAPEPLVWDSPKVRVLQQAENIYVNPAWNLGAREARGEYLTGADLKKYLREHPEYRTVQAIDSGNQRNAQIRVN